MGMLGHAEPIQVLTQFGDQKTQPLNKTDTVVFRRLQPFNATAATTGGYSETPQVDPALLVTSEGTTPTSNTISYTDVTTTLNQYAVLFKFSSKAQLMYEDNIPSDMQKITGETMGECAELVCFGQVKAGTNVIYANGATRAGLNSIISLNSIRLACRTMEKNRGKMVTEKIAPGPDYDTTPVEPGYIIFIHTDLVADVRDMPNFTERVRYGSAITPVHPREIGAVEDFRFVTSPLFVPWLAAGLAIGVDGMVSAATTRNDVYPAIVMGASAWGQCSLKGNGFTSISPTMISSRKKTHGNPSGMFGYVGADFWMSSVRLNENWMNRIECCATDISNP